MSFGITPVPKIYATSSLTVKFETLYTRIKGGKKNHTESPDIENFLLEQKQEVFIM